MKGRKICKQALLEFPGLNIYVGIGIQNETKTVEAFRKL